MRPWGIRRLVLLETLFLAVLGSALGLLGGVLLVTMLFFSSLALPTTQWSPTMTFGRK